MGGMDRDSGADPDSGMSEPECPAVPRRAPMSKAHEWLLSVGIALLVAALVGGLLYFTAQPDPDALLKAGVKALDEKDLDKAIACLTEFLQKRDNHPNGLYS